MSSEYQFKMALFHHRRAHRKSEELLSDLCDALEVAAPPPVKSELSLELRHLLDSKLRRLRETGGLERFVFKNLSDAAQKLSEGLDAVKEPHFQPYIDSREGGFFQGAPDFEIVLKIFPKGVDGLAVVSANLDQGIVIWEVIDDPLEGDFFEIESWGGVYDL